MAWLLLTGYAVRHVSFRCLAVLWGLLSLGHPLTAQPTTAAAGGAEPRWREARAWRQPDGLPQDSVLAILQTRDGYIWVGTRAGVSRFDGVRFTTFDDRNPAQLRENEVWGLVEGDDSSLWIGVYGGGLSRLKDGRFTVYSAKDGLADDFVRVLAKGSSGALWIGTDHGVSRWEDGRFTSYTEKEGLFQGIVRALLPEPDGDVWVATQGGLQRIIDGHLETARLPGMDSRSVGVVDALCRDRHGALWIGTDDGLLRVVDGTTTRYTTAEGLSSNVVHRMHEDPAGTLWIATAAGLDRYTGAASGVRVFANEAASNDITALHSDREGGLWVGHQGAGLARFHQGVFSTYTSDDGLPDSGVTTVLHGRSGVSWIGTAAGLSVINQGRFTTIGEENGMPRSTVWALAEDTAGYLWVGTGRGVYRSTESVGCAKRRCVPRFRPLGGDAILKSLARVILEDRSGAVWIGTDQSGLARCRQGRVTRFTTADGLSNDAIRALAEGKDGSLWIGTKGGGLDRLKDGALTKFTQDDGLPNRSIQALYMDPDDTLWIATRRGVSRYKDGRFTSYSVADGLYWNHVYAFVEDDKGNLWTSSGRGVFRVGKRQLNDFAQGRIRSIVSTAYGREHGLPSTMAAVASYPGASKSADGRVWFAMAGGLAVADPQRLSTNKVAPPVHIEEVRVDGRVLDLHAAAKAPAGKGDFIFRYTALSYEAPEGVRFKYRLDGFDSDWVDADTRRVAYYTNLPPGRYRFRAIAGNADGLWNDRGAEFALSLAPHVYQTLWFYGAVALALVLAGAGTQRLRVRGLQERERALSARVEEAVAQVKVLTGLLPICASCKKIRDDKGYWNQMEAYIHEHSEAQFSHGICPECADQLFPAQSQRLRERKKATPS